MELYGQIVPSVVSPVAYLPGDSLRAGWRVIAEWSHGWNGPTLPFWQEPPWELTRTVTAASGQVLYIEGNAGPIEVWQGTRLLYLGSEPTVWVSLVESRQVGLSLRSEGKGGILGGIYLLARSDTQAWPAEPYPAPPLCKEGASAACLCLPFTPPAHRQVALQRSGYTWRVGRCDQPGSSAPVRKHSGIPLSVLVLAEGALLVQFLPGLRSAIWRGFWGPQPADPLENLLGVLLIASLLSFWVSPGLVALAMGFLGAEALLLVPLGGVPQWSWQSWLLPLFLLLPLEWGLGGLDPLWIYGAWLARMVRFSLHSPYFAYLCTAEHFLYLLLRPT
ncbi:MAG: hypothetical protein KatS3mg026_0337 [Bacteroidia bacterium]|nr:MAG: hypothetical protein KatS3mg026_0337 [Bacteroidia bacterium]